MVDYERKPNRRPSAFQELYHPESTYLERLQQRIDADDRLFSVPLTRITSVPGCAVPSVGFLWGPAVMSRSCGFVWGSQESLTGPADPTAPGSGRSVHEALKMVSRCHSRNSLEGRSVRSVGKAIGCRARS
jgi:hypothetical protein